MSSFESPIPLSDIESVLEWVDSFKLSRPTKKINRDFSDAVLLAEILSVHYPKLVEMHNYPPRNSHSLKLNNWMTLNRKVLKKLKLNLCCNTMEQLANCASGVIERVLVMVRDRIRRDEEANKGKDSEQNMSSGGSYYEACGDDERGLSKGRVNEMQRLALSSANPSATYRVTLPEHVLVVPVKTRVNGVLETVQQKVVNYESYLALKEELKDAKDSADVLKQKVEHLDSLLKLKEERIDELQKQLERKQVRRKEAEALVNSLSVPFETVPSPIPISNDNPLYPNKTDNTQYISKLENNTNARYESIEIINPMTKSASVRSIETAKPTKVEESKIPVKLDSTIKTPGKPSITAVVIELEDNLDRIKSDVFKEIEIVDDKTYAHDGEEFKDSVQDTVTTIEETIQNEIKCITNPMEFAQGLNC